MNVAKRTICIRVVICGRVQGVGFRAWTSSTARRRQLSGWVRNRAEGTVEAVFCGAENEVNAMLAACRKGPMLARVDEIIVEEWEEMLEGEFAMKETV